jgi:hypothetical protein
MKFFRVLAVIAFFMAMFWSVAESSAPLVPVAVVAVIVTVAATRPAIPPPRSRFNNTNSLLMTRHLAYGST